MDFGLLLGEQLDAAVHRGSAEDIDDPVESLDESHAGSDEDGAHEERAEDPPEQDLVLVVGRHQKKRKIRRKTKRLSTLSESSMTYPVTNSSAGVAVPEEITTAKMTASAIQTTLQAKASRNFTVWERRWNTPRSKTSMARTKRLNKIQNSSNQCPKVKIVWGGHSCPPTLTLS